MEMLVCSLYGLKIFTTRLIKSLKNTFGKNKLESNFPASTFNFPYSDLQRITYILKKYIRFLKNYQLNNFKLQSYSVPQLKLTCFRV